MYKEQLIEGLAMYATTVAWDAEHGYTRSGQDYTADLERLLNGKDIDALNEEQELSSESVEEKSGPDPVTLKIILRALHEAIPNPTPGNVVTLLHCHFDDAVKIADFLQEN